MTWTPPKGAQRPSHRAHQDPKDRQILELKKEVHLLEENFGRNNLDILHDYRRMVELYVETQEHLHKYAQFLRMWEARYPEQYKDIVIEYGQRTREEEEAR